MHQLISLHSLQTSKTTLIIPSHSGWNTQNVFSSLYTWPRRRCDTVIHPSDMCLYLCLFVFLLICIYIHVEIAASFSPFCQKCIASDYIRVFPSTPTKYFSHFHTPQKQFRQFFAHTSNVSQLCTLLFSNLE